MTNEEKEEKKAEGVAWSRLVRRLSNRRAKGHCENCGVICLELQGHHIDPDCNGGSNDEDNVVMVCPDCHSAFHTLCRKYEISTRGRKRNEKATH